MKLKNYRQKRPPHIFIDKAIYFVTARTYNLYYHFKSDERKRIFKTVLNEAVEWINKAALPRAYSGQVNCADPKFGKAEFIPPKSAVNCANPMGSAMNCADPVNPDGTNLLVPGAVNCANPRACQLYGWVINNNHHHLLIEFQNSTDLPKFIRYLHGKTARMINDKENVKGLKIWQNYFETIVRNEKDFYTHLNYIHQNPIKHSLISDMRDLSRYEFCSYKDYLNSKGKEWLSDCFAKYPVIDFTAKEDGALG